MAKESNVMASVLAYEKKLVLSDGYMYGTTWENRYEEATPLALVEKSVRGTISNRLKPAEKSDPAKLNARIESANPKCVDSCTLSYGQDTLKLTFSIKVLSGVENPSACNNAAFNQKYNEVAKRYIEEKQFTVLAERYAMNIANGRFLWRNRLGAEKLEIKVHADGREWTFDGYDFSLKNFENTEPVKDLANMIAEALCGKRKSLFIDVESYALVGSGQEVYPSQEMVFDKGKEEKRKILYAVHDIAAMHSQKLSNAIRTIDTWYPAFATDEGVGPIAIEPYGAVTTLGKAFRNPKEKADFYTLFDKYALGEPLDSVEEEHYVMAVLVRGGVFGQSSKE